MYEKYNMLWKVFDKFGLLLLETVACLNDCPSRCLPTLNHHISSTQFLPSISSYIVMYTCKT